MKRCLSERTLWLVHEGAASGRDLAHLEGCLDCTARYGRLGEDLREITRTLRDQASQTGREVRRGRRRWVTAAAVLAGIGLLAGGEALLWRESKALVDPRPETAEALSLLEEVTLLLSSPGVTAASVLVADPASVIAELTSLESYEDDPIAVGGGRL
jgi:hypothetical protein